MIAIPPLASFSKSEKFGCGPLSVSFSNSSKALYSNYLWDFGNGVTSSKENPDPVNFSAGNNGDSLYYITLNVSNNCGSSNFIDSVTVYNVPVSILGLNLNTGCSPLTIHFANSSTGYSNSYFWDFGDGNTSNLSNPNSNVYTTLKNDTTYHISLISTNQCGTDTLIDSVIIHPNTVKSFFNTYPISGCSPLLVNFTNFSTLGCNYNWDFGDGNYSNQFNTSHLFLADNNDTTYTIKLAVDNGCSFDSFNTVIDVFPQPKLSFSVSNDIICSGNEIIFSSTTPNLSNIFWHFDDGSFSNLSSVTHDYLNNGTYNVSMIGTSKINGCVDTISKNVEITPTPDIHINPIDTFGCQPFIVNFKNNTLNADFFSWDFGDNNSSGLLDPTHIYNQDGSFNGTLVASNHYGCIDSVSFSVDVFPKPVSLFTTTSKSCQKPDTITFKNNSYGAIDYLWDFGNGETSKYHNPTTIYYSEQNYNITLISNSQYNCSDTSNFIYENHIIPKAEFTYEPIDLCHPKILFTNFSINSENHHWSFGDDRISTFENPAHLYSFFGESDVTLTVTNGYCIDSITKTIDHNYGNPANIYIPNAFTPNNDGLNDSFQIITNNGDCGYLLTIYDRWGLQIYTSKNLEDSWDGTINGAKVQVDTYVYILKGPLTSKVGEISVIR